MIPEKQYTRSDKVQYLNFSLVVPMYEWRTVYDTSVFRNFQLPVLSTVRVLQ